MAFEPDDSEPPYSPSTSILYTPTYFISAIILVIVAVSICFEQGITFLDGYLRKRQQKDLAEVLHRIRDELMLLGFISLLLSLCGPSINSICVTDPFNSRLLTCPYPSASLLPVSVKEPDAGQNFTLPTSVSSSTTIPDGSQSPVGSTEPDFSPAHSNMSAATSHVSSTASIDLAPASVTFSFVGSKTLEASRESGAMSSTISATAQPGRQLLAASEEQNSGAKHVMRSSPPEGIHSQGQEPSAVDRGPWRKLLWPFSNRHRHVAHASRSTARPNGRTRQGFTMFAHPPLSLPAITPPRQPSLLLHTPQPLGNVQTLSADTARRARSLLRLPNTEESESSCPDGQQPFISLEGLHELHLFIFLITVAHVLFSWLAIFLVLLRLRLWQAWEERAQAACRSLSSGRISQLLYDQMDVEQPASYPAKQLRHVSGLLHHAHVEGMDGQGGRLGSTREAAHGIAARLRDIVPRSASAMSFLDLAAMHPQGPHRQHGSLKTEVANPSPSCGSNTLRGSAPGPGTPLAPPSVNSSPQGKVPGKHARFVVLRSQSVPHDFSHGGSQEYLLAAVGATEREREREREKESVDGDLLGHSEGSINSSEIDLERGSDSECGLDCRADEELAVLSQRGRDTTLACKRESRDSATVHPLGGILEQQIESLNKAARGSGNSACGSQVSPGPGSVPSRLANSSSPELGEDDFSSEYAEGDEADRSTGDWSERAEGASLAGKAQLSLHVRLALTLSSFLFQQAAVTESDYATLRLAFIHNHRMSPMYDFHAFLLRSIHKDFLSIVGTAWYLWLYVILTVLCNVYGWNEPFWLSLLPLAMALAIGAKLKYIMAQMAYESEGRNSKTDNHQMLQPRDSLFWLSRPQFLLGALHLMLFMNAYSLALVVFDVWVFGTYKCAHGNHPAWQSMLQIPISLLTQFLCSFVTLPLYALVTHMGSDPKTTIFPEHVLEMLKGWRNRHRQVNVR